jgi:hypothetical protein
VLNRLIIGGACRPITLRARVQRGDQQVAQQALAAAVFGPCRLSNDAEVDPDDPAGERVSRKVAANLAGRSRGLEAASRVSFCAK